jgi:hypothetical protein
MGRHSTAALRISLRWVAYFHPAPPHDVHSVEAIPLSGAVTAPPRHFDREVFAVQRFSSCTD